MSSHCEQNPGSVFRAQNKGAAYYEHQGQNEQPLPSLTGRHFRQDPEGGRGRWGGQIPGRRRRGDGLGRPLLPGPFRAGIGEGGHAGGSGRGHPLPLHPAHRNAGAAGRAGSGHHPADGTAHRPQPERDRHPRLGQRPSVCHDALPGGGGRGADSGSQLPLQFPEPQASGSGAGGGAPL